MDISTFPRFHIYCDESSQTKHRYTVIGAAFCRSTSAPRIAATVEAAIAPFGGSSELKWQKVKRKNLPMYEAAVTTFFRLLHGKSLHYYCLVIDNQTVDHKKYSGDDHDLGFTKFVFTLLYKFSRIYKDKNLFYCFLDDRTTRHRPEAMQVALNARVRRDAPRGYDPYRLVAFTESHKSRLIQMTDIITGAIAYETNQHHAAAGPAEYKVALMKHAAKSAGVYTLAAPTRTFGTGFDIWHLEFKEPRRRR